MTNLDKANLFIKFCFKILLKISLKNQFYSQLFQFQRNGKLKVHISMDKALSLKKKS